MTMVWQGDCDQQCDESDLILAESKNATLQCINRHYAVKWWSGNDSVYSILSSPHVTQTTVQKAVQTTVAHADTALLSKN